MLMVLAYEEFMLSFQILSTYMPFSDTSTLLVLLMIGEYMGNKLNSFFRYWIQFFSHPSVFHIVRAAHESLLFFTWGRYAPYAMRSLHPCNSVYCIYWPLSNCHFSNCLCRMRSSSRQCFPCLVLILRCVVYTWCIFAFFIIRVYENKVNAYDDAKMIQNCLYFSPCKPHLW